MIDAGVSAAPTGRNVMSQDAIATNAIVAQLLAICTLPQSKLGPPTLLHWSPVSLGRISGIDLSALSGDHASVALDQRVLANPGDDLLAINDGLRGGWRRATGRSTSQR